MEKTYQKLLTPKHHVIATVLTVGVFLMMSVLLRPFTFSPDPLIAQIHASFAAIPIATTFWFSIYMFLVVLMDQLKQRAAKAE